ncbi:MAG: hypothetical protein Q7J07_02130, partial [Pelolinea sp.]|nr:hypothetical protein [Pelolinea sp.]
MIQALTNRHQQESLPGKNEYSRILSAAVINNHFRQMLLNDPVKAISNGYSGEQFKINSEE